MDILALILGLIASAFVVTLSLAKNQRTIALISIVLSGVLVSQYLVLDQLVAAVLSGMSLLYGLLVLSTLGRADSFSKAVNSKPAKIVLLSGYTLAFILLNGGLGWNLQLLAYFGSVLMVAVMMFDHIWATKAILLAAGVCWTIFQFQTGAYGNLVGQVFYFGGLMFSSWKLLRIRSVDRGSIFAREPQTAAL